MKSADADVGWNTPDKSGVYKKSEKDYNEQAWSEKDLNEQQLF
jgi:hypothetical protein